MLVNLLLGFMVGAWFFTLLTVTYVLWRYNLVPWKVMRTDVKALAGKIDEIEKKLVVRASTPSDPEIAAIEARLRAKQLGR
jgi:hypothetical protein